MYIVVKGRITVEGDNDDKTSNKKADRQKQHSI